MTEKTPLMLYVEDIEVNKNFWVDNFGAIFSEKLELIVITMLLMFWDFRCISIHLIPNPFIAQYTSDALTN